MECPIQDDATLRSRTEASPRPVMDLVSRVAEVGKNSAAARVSIKVHLSLFVRFKYGYAWSLPQSEARSFRHSGEGCQHYKGFPIRQASVNSLAGGTCCLQIHIHCQQAGRTLSAARTQYWG